MYILFRPCRDYNRANVRKRDVSSIACSITFARRRTDGRTDFKRAVLLVFIMNIWLPCTNAGRDRVETLSDYKNAATRARHALQSTRCWPIFKRLRRISKGYPRPPCLSRRNVGVSTRTAIEANDSLLQPGEPSIAGREGICGFASGSIKQISTCVYARSAASRRSKSNFSRTKLRFLREPCVSGLMRAYVRPHAAAFWHAMTHGTGLYTLNPGISSSESAARPGLKVPTTINPSTWKFET